MLRVQQISWQTIPLVRTDHGQAASSASVAPGLIRIPVNTQKKKHLCPGKPFGSAPGTMTSHALLSGRRRVSCQANI